MSDSRNKHTNKIAINILENEYGDYPKNWWHYDSEYKMLLEAQTQAWNQANEAAEQQEKALHKQSVNASNYDRIRHRLIGKACSLNVGEHNTRYEVATALIDTMIEEGII